MGDTMEFKPRNFLDITTSMVNYLAQHPDVGDGVLPSDLAVGSLERAHLEAVAVVQEEYDQRIADAIAQAIPNACFAAFGFQPLPARAAIGSVICTCFSPVPYDVTIPVGTVFQGPNGILFLSTAVGTITSGTMNSGSIPVQAQTSGVAGNVAENTITRLVSPIQFIDKVTNAQATTGGADVESESARALRFQAYLQTLPRGTKAALEFAAMSVVGVNDARSVEPFLLNPVPPGVPYAGRVWLFVDDGSTSATLDPAIQTAVENNVNGYVDAGGQAIPGYKAHGVVVDVLKSNPKGICVRGTVKLAPGAVARWTNIKANMTAAVVNYFESLRISESASYQNLVTAITMSDPDIREVVMAYWFESDVAPGYTDIINASPITPYDVSDPLSVGARLRAVQSTLNSVAYPEWVIG